MKKTALTLILGAILLPSSARATNPYCFNNLDRTTYDSGFSDSDFQSKTDMEVQSGHLKLVTDDKKLGDVNHITIRTRQDLRIYYLYESAGGSHTLGWFLWDDNVKKYTTDNGWNYTSQTCGSDSDCDTGMRCQSNGSGNYCAYHRYKLRDDGTAGGVANDQSYDWFEDMYLSSCTTCTPYLLTGNQSDGGAYPHIPNLLEHLVSQGGGWIFFLCDDDTDLATGGGSPRLPPVADISRTNNGIPDYDVNGDGSLTLDDRIHEMGTFDSGTELVFFHVMYYGQYMNKASAGIGSTQQCQSVHITCASSCDGTECNQCPTKCSSRRHYRRTWCYRHGCHACYDHWEQQCSGSGNSGTIHSNIIPFFSKRVLNPDYASSGNESWDRDIGCGYPHWCSGSQGWLDQATLDRLNSDFGIVMPHEVKRIYVRQDGQMNHMFLGAPSTDPTWWLLGFEDLYNGGDKDYNDIAFLVWRTNGGEAVSDIVSDEIPANERNEVTITKVHIKKSDHIPIPPCSSDPAKTRIEYYVAVSEDAHGNPLWIKVDFPADSPDEVTLDIQSMGYTGGELRWKAVIIADNHKCQPEVDDIDVGYEALKHGEYVFTQPIVLANALYRGTTETPSSTWSVTGNDRSNRGHFTMYEMYAPSNPNNTINQVVWDAGQSLANTNPDQRHIYTNNNGSLETFAAPGSSWLLQRILTSTDRTTKNNGLPVYDLDGDRDSDDDDARFVVQWARGWEQPNTVQRAWKLGSINSSNAAVVHVPGRPAWLEGTGISGTIKSGYQTWAKNQAGRRSIAIVGAQDGMLHAFDAGEFEWGDNPQTSVVEQRGYFKFVSGNPSYGDGHEVWAFVPESLLNFMKNNEVRNYYPELNPFAMVDGSVMVTDIYTQSSWKTAVFFTMGRQHPYLSGLDVTTPTQPRPLWPQDWSDSDFHGTVAAPTASWVNVGSVDPKGKIWMVATSSGLADTPSDVYLFLIDAATGQTLTHGKVKLNVGAGVRSERAYGVAGRPVLVDRDGDGYTDAIYVADTTGRVWRHEPNGAAGNSCLVASVGQPIYVTPVVSVRQDTLSGSNVVAFYFGTGDRPDENDTVHPPYSFYGFVDRDTPGTCSLSDQLYKATLPPDEKVWADAFVSADRVYVGTSTGDKANICDEDPTNPGHIYTFDLQPDSNGHAQQLSNPVSAGGSVVSGVIVYDQHLFANTLGGKTQIVGGSTWNNLASSASNTGLHDVYWQEVVQ